MEHGHVEKGGRGDFLRQPRETCSARRFVSGERYAQDEFDEFLVDYKSKRYAPALAKLDSIGRECGDFFDWLEEDQFANDRAITLLHLGRPAQCLAALDGTRAADSRDEESLGESVSLPPTDRDMYLPIARATWFNRDRCRAAMESRK